MRLARRAAANDGPPAPGDGTPEMTQAPDGAGPWTYGTNVFLGGADLRLKQHI